MCLDGADYPDKLPWLCRYNYSEYAEHYHHERNHQGLGNELIERRGEGTRGRVACWERLGGVLKYYYWKAA